MSLAGSSKNHWVKTESGFTAGSGSSCSANSLILENSWFSSSDCEMKAKEARLARLNLLLGNRSILRRGNSRESNRYSTISDAIHKLNFQHALNDTSCFPFICSVLIAVLERHFQSSSGSLQIAILRIIETANGIAIETRQFSGLMLRVLDRAVEIIHKVQFLGRSLQKSKRINSLLKMRKQLQEFLLEPDSGFSDTSLMCLPDDCLRHIMSFLRHPRDILNLGQTSRRLYHLMDDKLIWKQLSYYHYDDTQSELLLSQREPLSWAETFKNQLYSPSGGKLKEEVFSSVCVCKICNFVFWKSYGHPCLQDNPNYCSGLTAQGFINMFT